MIAIAKVPWALHLRLLRQQQDGTYAGQNLDQSGTLCLLNSLVTDDHDHRQVPCMWHSYTLLGSIIMRALHRKQVVVVTVCLSMSGTLQDLVKKGLLTAGSSFWTLAVEDVLLKMVDADSQVGSCEAIYECTAFGPCSTRHMAPTS